jgi:sialate O-acetylesterase
LALNARSAVQSSLTFQHRQAISFDLGEPQNIHPQRKQEIGRRLARIALKRTYGQTTVVDTGPEVNKIEREGAGFRVRFKSPNGWPVLAALAHPITGFELAGEDKVFKPAVAVIGDRNTSVLVTSAEVPNPVAVRYGWRDFPMPVWFITEKVYPSSSSAVTIGHGNLSVNLRLPEILRVMPYPDN